MARNNVSALKLEGSKKRKVLVGKVSGLSSSISRNLITSFYTHLLSLMSLQRYVDHQHASPGGDSVIKQAIDFSDARKRRTCQHSCCLRIVPEFSQCNAGVLSVQQQQE